MRVAVLLAAISLTACGGAEVVGAQPTVSSNASRPAATTTDPAESAPGTPIRIAFGDTEGDGVTATVTRATERG